MTSPQRPADAAITSPRSDRVRRIASLTGRSARRRHGMLRVEGPQAVRSLLEHRPDAAVELFVTSDAAQAHPEIRELAGAAGIPQREVDPEILLALVRDRSEPADGGASVSPQGIVATASIPALEQDLVSALDRVGAGGDAMTVLVLHELQDPGNVGTLIRTADATGADLVVLTRGSVDVHAPKVVRSSAGSLFHLPVVAGADPAALLAGLRGAGVRILATSGHAEHDLFSAELPERLAWWMGNEAHGLPEELLDAADLSVRIPLAGRAESLNVAVAATVCLYETLRRRRVTASAEGITS